MYKCRICAVNYWFKAYYYLGNNAPDNATVISECLPCPANARCGGGLCLPVPTKGYWSQGVDRSTTNPDGVQNVVIFIYLFLNAPCKSPFQKKYVSFIVRPGIYVQVYNQGL